MGPAVALGLVLAAALHRPDLRRRPPAAAAAAGGPRRRARGRRRRCRARTSPTSSRTRSTRRSACCWPSSRCSPRRATRRPARAAGSPPRGACLGLCLLTKPENAIALGLALGGWLAVRVVLADPAPPRPPSRRRALGDVGLALGPALLLGLGGYAAFFLTGAVVDHPLTLDALIHGTSSRPGCCASRSSVVYDVLAPRTPGELRARSPAELALYLAGTAALIAIGLTLAGRAPWRRAVLAAAGLRRRRRPGRARRRGRRPSASTSSGPSPGCRPARCSPRCSWPGCRSACGRGRGRAPGRSRSCSRFWPSAFSYSAYARVRALPEPELPAGHGLRDAGRSRSCWPGCTSASLPRLLPLGASSVRLVGTVWVALLAVVLRRAAGPRRAQGDRRRPRPARDDTADARRRLGLPAGGRRRPGRGPAGPSRSCSRRR